MKSLKHALLVLANLVVSAAVSRVAGGVSIGIALDITAKFRVLGLAGYTVFLAGPVAIVASYLGCSWIFASRFARDDRRGHLAVVWGITALAIAAFLIWLLS